MVRNIFSAAAVAASALTGAGSGLVAPLEAEWAAAFQAIYGVTVNYNSVGSQAAISDITSRTVDFASTDAPMTGQQASACKSCYQIPWALSALAIGFHINGVSGELKLSPAVLSEIYLGRIKVCNDSRITSLNPGLHLPALKITPIYAAATGDTYVFTSYLSAVDSTWKRQVGAGPSVSFPTGTLANGNAGVTATLESTNGAIAYVGAAYLIAHQLPAAAIENAAGTYVYPNLGNIEAAAKTIKKVTRNALHISNPPRSARRVPDLDVRIRRGAVERDPEEAVEGLASVRVASGTGVRPPPHYAAIPSVVLRASIAAVNRFGA